MPKRKEPELPVFNETIIQQPLEEVVHASMMPYAEYVILERALPRVEDGLKPVQRRILYTMHDLSNTPDKPHRKSARIVGDCLGKYHPHGDSSVYEAMVRMAQPFVMRGQLVDGHGNFGSIDGDSAAASRYTEVRMTQLSLALLEDIEKDTVPFRLNFDDTLKEPDMLPGRFPNLLVNGASGIAVGLATNMPPHNLREAIDCVIAQMENPDLPLSELMKYLRGPDFPTGGLLLSTDELRIAYETGRGKLTVRAKLSIEDGSNGRKLIVITEMPYQVSKAAMLEKILKVSEEKKGALSQIYDIRDESDRTGLRAVIELKKDADVDKVLAMLYKYTDLQITFGVNMVAIADGKPMQLSLRELNAYYIRHQKTVVTRRTQYELDQARAREHILIGLMIAVDNLDAVLALIRASKNGKEAREGLMASFDLSELQAQAILDLRLQRLTGLEILSLRKEYEEIKALIERLEGILGSEKKLLAVIKKEMLKIRDMYGDDRRTIITDITSAEIPKELFETKEEAQETVVILTRSGFLKRIQPKLYAGMQSGNSENNLAEAPRFIAQTMTDRRVLLFTTKGNCYPVAAGQVPECKPRDRGTPLAGILPGYEGDERICAVLEPGDSDELLCVTEKGMIKRTAASEYFVRKGKYAAINLKSGDSLLDVRIMKSDCSILLVTRLGMSINFNPDFGATGRTTAGVRAITLERGDSVIFAAQSNGEGELLLVSDRGYMKRSLMVDYDLQGRGGKGLKTFQWSAGKANGESLAAVLSVREPFMFHAVQKSGAVTQIFTDEIAIEHRFSKGKPYVMALLEDIIVEAVCF